MFQVKVGHSYICTSLKDTFLVARKIWDTLKSPPFSDYVRDTRNSVDIHLSNQ